MSDARDWVEEPTALGVRGGALEEAGVGTSTQVATTPTAAEEARNLLSCLRYDPCAVVSVGGDLGRPSRRMGKEVECVTN